MTDSLRIAVIAACPFPWPRGTPIRVHRIAEAVARRGHAVHVVTYHLGEELADPPFIVHRIRDVPFYRRTDSRAHASASSSCWTRCLSGLLRRLHRKIGFDLVHAHHYEGLLVASTLSAEFRSSTMPIPCWPASCPPIGSPSRAALIRAVAPWLDRSPAPAGRPHHRRQRDDSPHAHDPRRLRARRVHVIPSGVEWERFPVGTLDRAGWPHGHLHRQSRALSGGGSHAGGVRPTAWAPADGRLMIVTDSPFTPYEALARGLGVRAAVDLRHATFSQNSRPSWRPRRSPSTLGSNATASRRSCSITWPPAFRS